MSDYTLPFPSRALADRELTYDPCYEKIPAADRVTIVNAAWAKGEQAASDLFCQSSGETDFFNIARENNLAIVELDKDYMVGNRRYFSEYLSGKSEIKLYLKSIALWAQQNKMTLNMAKNLILSHEYYHFLECTSIGLTSRDYQVPVLILGSFKLGRTGIRALSEIGAHAFAYKYYMLTSAQAIGYKQTEKRRRLWSN